MKRLLIACSSAALLAGCSAPSAVQEEPEPAAPNPNISACENLENLSEDFVTLILDPTSDANRLENIRGEFDEISLSAEGDVKERVSAIVDTIPEHPVFLMTQPANDYFQALEDAGRACSAETGEDFAVHTWK